MSTSFSWLGKGIGNFVVRVVVTVVIRSSVPVVPSPPSREPITIGRGSSFGDRSFPIYFDGQNTSLVDYFRNRRHEVRGYETWGDRLE